MEPKRPESFGERTADDIERDAGTVRRDAGDLGSTLDRDVRRVGNDADAGVRDVGRGVEGVGDRVDRAVGDVGDAARTSIDAVGDAVHRTLAPGESVAMVPPGETEVVDVSGGTRTSGQTAIGGAASAAAGTGTVPAAAGAATVGSSSGSGLEGGELRSMSTDNTAAGRTGDIGNTGPIDLAVTGMRVVDANGDELGKVDDIKMGDPGAASTRGEQYDDGDLVEDIGRAVFGDSDLPEQIREDLIRVGYIRVDGKGWFDTDYFVAANEISRVEGDTVHLSVAKEALPTV